MTGSVGVLSKLRRSLNGRRVRLLALAASLLLCSVYLGNASWLARPRSARPLLLAHRGVHQTFACNNLQVDTCTATCIHPPTHEYLENTIPSMRAAFELGAAIVEIDIHPTTDGEFAVFHDWRLECRTNGTGVTREQSMTALRLLDLGYGYTADGGKTYPLRGRGEGMMPSLREVLETLPGKRFLLHIKSNDVGEAERLAALLRNRSPEDRSRLLAYGADRPLERLQSLVPELRTFTRERLKSCLARYALIGWSGYIPSLCRQSLILVPKNYARYLWGWPHRFLARLQSVGTEVFVVGDYGQSPWLSSINTAEEFQEVTADNFAGGVWTDRIEILGPIVQRGGEL